jgi:hypothetical protein
MRVVGEPRETDGLGLVWLADPGLPSWGAAVLRPYRSAHNEFASRVLPNCHRNSDGLHEQER